MSQANWPQSKHCPFISVGRRGSSNCVCQPVNQSAATTGQNNWALRNPYCDWLSGSIRLVNPWPHCGDSAVPEINLQHYDAATYESLRSCDIFRKNNLHTFYHVYCVMMLTHNSQTARSEKLRVILFLSITEIWHVIDSLLLIKENILFLNLLQVLLLIPFICSRHRVNSNRCLEIWDGRVNYIFLFRVSLVSGLLNFFVCTCDILVT